MSDARAELLAYYAGLAELRRELPGATLLHSPGSPVIGANAAYADTEEGALRARLWFRAQGAPAVLASAQPVPNAEEVLRLRVGTYTAQSTAPACVVEQASRLHLPAFAAVLARAWELPTWGPSLGRSLARALEFRRDFTLLLAYGDDLVGGALLLHGAAHLWGVTKPDVLPSLLNAAAQLNGGQVRTSGVAGWEWPLRDAAEVGFWLAS